MKWQRWIALILAGGTASALAAPIATPVIQWQRSFGGTNDDYPGVIRQTADGGYLVGATTTSPPGGNKASGHYGDHDCWLLRLDAGGDLLWERSYGGTSLDGSLDLLILPDQSILLGATSSSETNSTKTAPLLGERDYWLLKLDAAGNRLWDRTHGGPGHDSLACVAPAGDGGFLLGGQSGSPVGPGKTSASLGFDAWIVRTDPEGHRLWDRSLGGTSGEVCSSLSGTGAGGFLMCGDSWGGAGGSKTSPSLGGADTWIVRLDASGNPLWDKSYGGTDQDEFAKAVSLPDGGFIVIGSSRSAPAGDFKTSPFRGLGSNSGGDYWVLRLDANGERVWDKSFGGTSWDLPWDVVATSDGGFLVCGGSNSETNAGKSAAGFGPAMHGWLVRLDGQGERLWEMALGGDAGDTIRSVAQTRDGGFILAGTSRSGLSGNKTTPNFGMTDVWILKLGPDALTGPQLRALEQSPQSIRANGFRLEVRPSANPPAGALYLLEASTNLSSWEIIQSAPLAPGACRLEFSDAAATNHPARFYRVRMEP